MPSQMQTWKLNIFLVVVFSMLFGRQNKFPTSMYFFPLYMFKYFIRLLTTALKAQHWGGSLAQVFLHRCFFCLPCTECTIFVQRDHWYLVLTFFAAIAIQSDDSQNNGTISCSHYFLSHQFFSSPNFTKQLIPPMLFCIDDIQSFFVRQSNSGFLRFS